MHCFSSRGTSWLTWTLRVGGCVLRRRIGASVIRPSHLGWPTQHQRRAQEAVAVLWSQTIPWDRHRQIERKFCTIVGGVVSPLLSVIYMNRFLKHWRLTGRGETFRAHVIAYADDFVIQPRSRGRGADVDEGSDGKTRADPQRGENLAEGCSTRELRLPWLYAGTTPLSQWRPLVPGGEPVQAERAAGQGEDQRTAGAG